MNFHFTAGRVSLDFANTGGEDIAGKLGPAGARYEDLATPADCARWLRECALALPPLAVTEAELTQVRQLRDAIWYSAHACLTGSAIDGAQRDVINTAARRPTLVPQLVAAGEAPVWHEPALAAALSALARDAIDLMSGAEARRIRECAGARCILLFVDTSRPGRRRWCDMERCGNQVKTASYRRRHTTPDA
jgi:predicted RNA-binding Zn ribbon-like protein